MRKLILRMLASLDGFIADAGGEVQVYELEYDSTVAA